jgi:hypothetical protein
MLFSSVSFPLPTSLRRKRREARAALSAFMAALVLSFGVPALADTTTGVINGTVLDEAGKPVPDVSVTAVAPTGRYKAKTDGRGFFVMTGIQPDTYAISFEHEGYEPVSSSGITVGAGQTAVVNKALAKGLKTIGTVQARSSASAFQGTQTTDTVTVNSTQIENLLGSTLNTDQSQLVASLPGGMLDSSGYPNIHGGREYETGFEFEGIPYTDAYSNQFINSLRLPGQGIGSAQLTAGGGDASNFTNGTGTFNLISKRGTSPGYADFETGITGGLPQGYNHSLNAEWSWATADGRYSNYAAFSGTNSVPQFGTGALPTLQINAYNGNLLQTSREFIDNFVFKFGKDNTQGLQLFTDIAQNNFYTGIGGIKGLCYASCDNGYQLIWSEVSGLTPQQVTAISGLYPGQSYGSQPLDKPIGTYYQPQQAFKVEYNNSLNSSTFLSVRTYRVNSTDTQDFPEVAVGSFSGDAFYLGGGQESGVTLSLQKQLGEQNLVQFGADYHFLHPINDFRSDSYGLIGTYFDGMEDTYFLPYAFVKPSDPNCLLGTDPNGNSYCGYAYTRGVSPNSQQTYPQWAQVASINQSFYSLFASDKITVSPKLNLNLGLRFDEMANIGLPAQQVDPNYCTTQYLPATWTANPNYNPNKELGLNGTNCPYNATFNYPRQAIDPAVLQPRIGAAYELTPNFAIRATYGRSASFPNVSQVAYGDVSQGVYQNAPWSNLPAYNALYNYENGLPAGQYTAAGAATTNCGNPGYSVPCKNFGEQLYWANQYFDGIPFQPVKPMVANNYQVTFQGQFAGGSVLHGVAVSVAPWYRHQYDTIAQVANPIFNANGTVKIVNGSAQFLAPINTNNGKETASGIDLNITKENRYGLSGQLTATYINEFSSVPPLSSSEDFYPTIPTASLLQGAVYRVGFVSPFQSTLGLTWRTKSGWRINPRYSYNIGYPNGAGTLTPAFVNGQAVSLPNTNVVAPANSPNGPAYYIDPLDPGSLFHPNVAATRGYAESASAGGTLSPAQGSAAILFEWTSPKDPRFKVGFDVENLFNEYYGGPYFNSRYEPVATGISGNLSGHSAGQTDYLQYPYAWPLYQSYVNGPGVFTNFPNQQPRSFYIYLQAGTK